VIRSSRRDAGCGDEVDLSDSTGPSPSPADHRQILPTIAKSCGSSPSPADHRQTLRTIAKSRRFREKTPGGFSIQSAAMLMQPHQIDRDVLIIQATDAINADQTMAMIDQLEAEIDAGKCRKIVVDCSQIEFLSSFGLSMLLRLRNAARQSKGDVKLAGLKPILLEMFRLSKMTQQFMLYPDVEQARQGFHLKST